MILFNFMFDDVGGRTRETGEAKLLVAAKLSIILSRPAPPAPLEFARTATKRSESSWLASAGRKSGIQIGVSATKDAECQPGFTEAIPADRLPIIEAGPSFV